MRKKFSLYHLMVVMMLTTLLMPAFASATVGPTSPTGSLTIHKYEQEPNSEQGDPTGEEGQEVEGTPLKGVKFVITQTHRYDPQSDKWEAVENGVTYERTTGDDGKIVINPIELGRYKVKETEGPPHVNLNEEEYFVDIPMTNADGNKVNYNVHIYPKNETIRGAVELTKKDGDSKTPLAGVKFSLYKANGEKVKENLITDENGKIRVSGLAYGDYYFTEDETIPGYVKGSQKVEFKIKKSGGFDEDNNTVGKVVKVNVSNYVEPEVEKEVDRNAVNRGEIVEYSINVQLPADIKEYKKFVVTDTLDNNLQFVSEGPTPAGFTFSQDGQQLTWTATPAQLEKGEVTFKFKAKVKEDAPANEPIENKAIIDYENKHGITGEKESKTVDVLPTAGSLTVIKQDGDSKEKLAGAEFELRKSTGELVATGVSGEDGVVNFNGATDELDYGTYVLKETKAPEGYNLRLKEINVTIDGENDEVTLTVDNYKSGWELPKTGGIGTILFTLSGLTLMGSSLLLYVRKRKGEVV